MKKLIIFAVVIAMMISMSTAGFATENEVTDLQTTTDVQETEYMLGDINENGELDAIDYTLLKRAYFGIYELGDAVETCADTNENGEIDATDYTLLKRAYFGTYELGDRGDDIVEPEISYKDLYANDYDEYVDVLKDITLPDYFVSYDDVSIFGEFDYFMINCDGSGPHYERVFYSFVDETGTNVSVDVEYIPKLPDDYTKQIPEIDSKNINTSDMRTVNYNGTTAIKYTYQGIKYVYSKYGTLMSMSWQCGDIRYSLSVIGDYPITDKDTAVNRLLNLESAPSVIAGLKGNVSETSASE